MEAKRLANGAAKKWSLTSFGFPKRVSELALLHSGAKLKLVVCLGVFVALIVADRGRARMLGTAKASSVRDARP